MPAWGFGDHGLPARAELHTAGARGPELGESVRPESSQSAQPTPGFGHTVMWTLERLNQRLDDLTA